MANPAPIDVVVPKQLPSKADREYAAFQRLLPQLLATLEGRYVAIHDEKVVDDDVNDIELIRRVHDRIGYVPIFAGLVSQTVSRERIPHYREYRGRARA